MELLGGPVPGHGDLRIWLRSPTGMPHPAGPLNLWNKLSDILFDLTKIDPNELLQWEVFSGVRVNSLYPKHMDVRFEFGDMLLDTSRSRKTAP